MTRAELDSGWRLGCQAILRGSATIEVQPAIRAVAPKSFGRPELTAGARSAIFTESGGWGLAIDIGSTTLAVGLVNPDDGHVESAVSRLNPQVACGADVMSRIHFAETSPGGASRLTELVRSELAGMIRDLLEQSRVAGSEIVGAACAGNPTMLHLWAGKDVSPLGRAPFLSPWTAGLSCTAREVDLPIRPTAAVYAFPSIGSHVGADAVAAAVAAGLDLAERPTLLIDLGTNSEVVAGWRGHLVAASTAAGPAFEGGAIRCGMRASRGAIDTVSLVPGGGLLVDTIDHAPGVGICGSGLVDAVAELHRAGMIADSGYLRSGSELQGAPLADRSVVVDGRRAVVLADHSSEGGRRIVLTAPDIRQLQLVKGSIRAGISVLCRELAIQAADLDAILIAGLFGSHVRKSSLLRIGLVPRIDPERVRFIGNAAGIGARLALFDGDVRDRARRLAATTRLVDLASHPAYVSAFHESLSLPS